MKGRSHWLPVSEPHHDDWVDGSWTVDCICGVTFDDGEEMVNCDECGVWVHTRCSRYVKSEKSFACDKCKDKNVAGGSVIGNDTEETEVAEFLVELPTKTLIMENPNLAGVVSRGPVRLCAPMEERVHVQGVPGGDPDLFYGLKMSSIFGPGLWKSTGYVPKKFNFRYTEFPCSSDDKALDNKDEEMNKRSNDGNVYQADNGAGFLFSLSKKNVKNFPSPLVDSTIKIPVGDKRFHEVLRHKKRLDVKNLDSSCPEDSVKGSRSKQTIKIYSGKHKEEGIRMSKDQSAKKKVRIIKQDRDVERKSVQASEAVASTFSSDAEQFEFSHSKGSKVLPNKFHRGKDVLADQLSDGLGECATNLAANECGLDAALTHNIASYQISKEGVGGEKLPVRFESTFKTFSNVASLTELDGSRSISCKEEIFGDDHSGDIGGDAGGVQIPPHNKESMAVVVTVTSADAKESETGQDTSTHEDNSRPIKKLKAEADFDGHGGLHVQLDGVKLDNIKNRTQYPQLSARLSTEGCKTIETPVIKSEARDHKLHDGSRSLHVSKSATDKYDEAPACTTHCNQHSTGLEGPTEARTRPSGSKHDSEVTDEPLKSIYGVTCNSRAPYQSKVVVYLGKSASTSNKDIASTAQNPRKDSREKELSESSTENMNENSSIKAVRADQKFVRTRKLIKDSSRLNSVSNAAQLAKSSSSLDSKTVLSDSMDVKRHSSRTPLVSNVTATPCSGDSSGSPLIEGASNEQNKATGSTLPVKGEKIYQSGNHSVTKGNVASTNAPAHSNDISTIHDEQIALLLHHELNSSPRVSRVPRMLHAGSLPQLTCPTATSLKRTSSSGGKDQGGSYRTKTKDLSGDALHGTVADDEFKKMDRKPSSPDKRKRDAGVDPVSRRGADSGSVKGVHSIKMTNVTNSLSSSNDSNVQNLSSNRPSSKSTYDNNPRMVGCPTNRTLPGLIADIMKKGNHMSMEELCNAVEPHWPHLRKHNGEPYAYSTPSQAVLDCLRNRSEWASLIDRGPKASASRKRRKTDTVSLSIESADDKRKRGNFESKQQEELEFPKGKRKARKGRRLTLQGRNVVRWRRSRADFESESDDDDSSEEDSMSSEEDSMSSENEEIQEGGGASVTGNETSASSDEVL